MVEGVVIQDTTVYMKNIAVILAGGVGKRLGGERPKQFLMVGGRMVIEHTVEAFERHEGIDEIAIVMNPDHVGEMEEIVKRNGWKKVSRVLKGGAERYHSTLAAIEGYGDDYANANMIFHDAVRPCVSKAVIDRVIEALEEHEAVNVGVASTDTIMEVDGKGEYITKIPNRKMLRRVQTPQGFRVRVIKEAYRRAMANAIESTDDCGMVLKYMPEIPIYVVDGEERNVKLTYREDVDIINNILSH